MACDGVGGGGGGGSDEGCESYAGLDISQIIMGDGRTIFFKSGFGHCNAASWLQCMKIGTFRFEDEDECEYEFSILNMRIGFGGRHFSKCACSEQETRTRSRPHPPI